MTIYGSLLWRKLKKWRKLNPGHSYLADELVKAKLGSFTLPSPRLNNKGDYNE